MIILNFVSFEENKFFEQFLVQNLSRFLFLLFAFQIFSTKKSFSNNCGYPFFPSSSSSSTTTTTTTTTKKISTSFVVQVCRLRELSDKIGWLNSRMVQPWSSLDKEEPLGSQITFPFNNKLGCFKTKLTKQPIFLLSGKVIWQANGSLYIKSSMVYLTTYHRSGFGPRQRKKFFLSKTESNRKRSKL